MLSDSRRHLLLTDLFKEMRGLDQESRRARIAELRAVDAEMAEELEDLLRHAETPALASEPILPTAFAEIVARFGSEVAGAPADGGSEGGAGPGSGAGAAGERGGDAHAEQGGRSAPSNIGRYTIIRELGEGGMGVVYLAEQQRPRRTVALKIMRQGFGRESSSMRKRFERETQVLGRLEHPGIARIYDAGTAEVDNGRGTVVVPFFAMEHVDGLQLVEHAETHRLGTRERMALMERICDAVASAHRQGVVHRDLKPGNILVDRTGQPKILDFGVARLTGSDLAVTTLHTDVGQIVGTLPYMSPEQVEGDVTRLDARCDVYALGVVAYELLTGRLPLPVRGLSVAEAARIIRDDDPTPLSAVSRVFRGDLHTIVSKALEKDPNRRYRSAEELGADIGRYLRDEPIVARPASTAYQLAKFARRNRGLVGGVLTAFVLLLLGLAGTTWGLLRAAEQRDVALAAEGRAKRRFDELHRLANRFIYDFHDAIVDLPGSTPVRKELVATALTYLDTLAAESDEDSKLQADLAEAYLKVGMAQGYHSKANLGDAEGAMESFVKARQIREKLVERAPDDVAALTALTRAQSQIANLDFSEGRLEKALAGFEEIRRVRQHVASLQTPGTKEWDNAQRDVSLAHQWIGNVLAAMKRPEEALASYRKQHEIAMAGAQGGEPLRLRDLSVSHEKLGDVLVKMERTGEAVEEYLRSLEIRRQLAELQPESVEAATDLAVSLGKVGNRMLADGRLNEAEVLLGESHSAMVELSSADPDNVLAKTNLVVALHRLATLDAARAEEEGLAPERRRELLAAAVAQEREAVEILKALRDADRLENSKIVWIDELGKAADEFESRLREAEKPPPADG